MKAVFRNAKGRPYPHSDPRVARRGHRIQGRRPRIILDTHDIQSDFIFARRENNPFARRLDSRSAHELSMSCGVIVVAPPWPRSGSGNIFAAQVAAHARRGARVLLLLAPPHRGYARHKTEYWRDAVASMRYPGVDTVAYPRTGRGRIRAYVNWLRAGCDDSLAIAARYGASGRLPADLQPFLASAQVDLIHVNHAFSMPLALRVAGLVHRVQGRRPRILLDTHDVQSDVIFARGENNPLARRLDSRAALLRTELALCAGADALVHVTRADGDFFASHLPDKHHAVVLPTLNPAHEMELMRRRGQDQPDATPGDGPGGEAGGSWLIYVGNEHMANLATVRWLLAEVLPLAGPRVADRVRIIGAIGGLLRRRDPELFSRHATVFAGEVASIFEFYSHARAVLAPAVAGTGTSIKLIEALCAGKPVVTTTLGLRGLPAGEMADADIAVHDTAAAFAKALTGFVDDVPSVPAISGANAALYDRLFSNKRFFAALDAVIEGRTGGGA
jgi:glycosyltransferase involved in cell wall biosynthesis